MPIAIQPAAAAPAPTEPVVVKAAGDAPSTFAEILLRGTERAVASGERQDPHAEPAGVAEEPVEVAVESPEPTAAPDLASVEATVSAACCALAPPIEPAPAAPAIDDAVAPAPVPADGISAGSLLDAVVGLPPARPPAIQDATIPDQAPPPANAPRGQPIATATPVPAAADPVVAPEDGARDEAEPTAAPEGPAPSARVRKEHADSRDSDREDGPTAGVHGWWALPGRRKDASPRQDPVRLPRTKPVAIAPEPLNAAATENAPNAAPAQQDTAPATQILQTIVAQAPAAQTRGDQVAVEASGPAIRSLEATTTAPHAPPGATGVLPAHGIGLSSHADGAHAIADLAAPPRFERLLEQLRGELQTGKNEFRLTLDPPELGRLDVRIVAQGTGVVLHLLAERGDVAQWLRTDLPIFQRSTAQDGLEVLGVEVRSWLDLESRAKDEHRHDDRVLEDAQRGAARVQKQRGSLSPITRKAAIGTSGIDLLV